MIGDRPAEEDPLRTAALLRAIGDAAIDLIFAKDRDGCLIYANTAYCRLVGRPLTQVLGLTTRELAINADDAEAIMASDRRIMASGLGEVLEEPFTSPDGILRVYRSTRTPMRGGDGGILGIAAICTDVTDIRQREQVLRETENRLRMATDAAAIGIWDYDLVNLRLNWDDRCKALFGLGPDAHVTYEETFVGGLHPEDRDATLDAANGAMAVGGSGTYDVEYRTVGHEDGIVRWVAATGRSIFQDGRAIRFIGTLQDISQQKQAEETLRGLAGTLEQRVAEAVAERELAEGALRQAQKMEAVGQLTGGIAHDFNNLLTVVIGNIDMGRRALEAAGGDARTKRALDNAQKGAERAASLTQRLLAFSRRQPLEPKPLDINKLVLGMSDLLGRAIGEMVKIEIVTSPGLWRVEADPNQLESALLNLAVNARDAMPAGGNLTIETANTRLDEAYTASQAEVAPGPYVMIAVTDTGSGMSKDVVSRVFEPFFTTKDVGRGTGLGLSQVYGFVKQSGGHVKVYSEQAHGTTVKLYLPRLMVETVPEEEQMPGAIEVGRHEETILVVEDDDDVRAFTVEILRATGYRVLEAHDGPSALRLLERQSEPIDLLFTDVVMPGMSGRDLAEIARVRQPGVKVLFTSGYTRDAIVHGGRLDNGIDMIAKPFTFLALSQKVRDMLDRGQTGRLLCVQPEGADNPICTALRDQGYALDHAVTGSEALGRVRASTGRYDAVIVDEALQDRTGEGIVNAIRSLFRDVPILLLSGVDAADRIREHFVSDPCTDVATKPVDPERLLAKLHELGVRCAESHSGG